MFIGVMVRDSLAESFYHPGKPHLPICILISIPATKVKSGLKVEIEDNGTGMDEKTLGQAFEPLFTTKIQGSTGLGLAIVKKIIEEHDGTVYYRKQP